MIQKKMVLLTCLFSLVTACSYNTTTQKTHFMLLGLPTQELIEGAAVAAHDIKECAGGGSDTCKTKTAHDGYEESKIKSMNNEELAEYVKKHNKKTK